MIAESGHVHPQKRQVSLRGPFLCGRRADRPVDFLRPTCARHGRSKLPNYFSRSRKTENGLPDNAVTAVAQTGDGYLWIGTYGGLVRFDGVRFKLCGSKDKATTLIYTALDLIN